MNPLPAVQLNGAKAIGITSGLTFRKIEVEKDKFFKVTGIASGVSDE